MNSAPTHRDESAIPADLAAAIALGGEMGRRLGEFDWAAHPLGPLHSWPSELRSIVAVTLTSRFPIVLWIGQPDLFLVYNDPYSWIMGDKHPAALGAPAREVWWEIWDQIGPMLRSVLETGRSTWSRDLMLPLVTTGQPEERYFTFSYSPLFAADGSIPGVFCAVNETTDRVLSDRRLHLLNDVASAVMAAHTVDEAVREAVSICAQQPADLPFVAVYTRDEQAAEFTLRGATPAVRAHLPRSLAAFTAQDPTRWSRADTVVLEDLRARIPGLATIFEQHEVRQAVVLALGEGSAAGAAVIGINPMRPLDSQYLAFCHLLADQLASAFAAAVSYEQQRQRADALAEIDRAKTAFLTNVSHEFRTPLTLLLGPLDDALAEATDDALADRLATARRNAGRLLRLVDSLLDFSRIEAGRATADPVHADVGALTAHIAGSFTELCRRAGLELIIDCAPVLAEIDTAMWETIVLNLLSNAVKFTFEGSIRVEVRAEPHGSRITVRDTGIGISRKDLDRLFERFYRADNAHGRSVEGSGIGLSLVRGLVELQHGTIEIDSELDRGTAVTIRLPAAAADAPVEFSLAPVDPDNPYVAEAGQWLIETGEDAPPDGGKRELILIADDNADMRRHLARVLSTRWRTMLVADGEAALRAVREHRPDMVVTDVMMPGLDGFEFVAAVRADPALAPTPVLMLSARAGSESASEGFAHGADDYLPKPFGSQELIDRVAARLGAAARERARRRRRDADVLRTTALARLDAALQGTETVAEILTTLRDSHIDAAPAAAVGIAVLDADTDRVRIEYAGDFPTELRDRYHVLDLDAPMPVVAVVRGGHSMVVRDIATLDGRYQHFAQDVAGHIRSLVVHPLRDDASRIFGALLLGWPRPQAFDDTELEVLARTAEMTESALARVRVLQREHRIAVDFQEHLLDLDHRSTGAVVSGVYQPAGEAMRVGGDWYLAAPLEDPARLGISVGDVVGHGLPAAIVMSRLRAALAATALTAADSATVLDTLDRYATGIAGARCATVVYAVIDSDCGTMDYTCAGHPYPLLVTPDGHARYLTGGRRPPIAAWRATGAEATGHERLAPGSLVLLYTDGLIERPGETLDDGFARLRAAVAACARLPVGAVCDELVERMAPPGGYTDDVALLVVRPAHAGPDSLATVVAAVPSEVPPLRDRLRRWIDEIDVDPQRRHDILLAVGEAVTNAIEHGAGSDPRGTVSLEAFRHADHLTATVSDTGRWSRDSSASHREAVRGRGLTLINGLADRVETVRTNRGTRITLRFDLPTATAPTPANGAHP
ncbi:SpoIIE family protein phosphatase [Nocardia sp. CDC159]|uniref:histidine kinase n=1 Tax=Nocardia pulmonis TaxID=2951408 RepID=A0A9X2EBG0_9NOCA|nr:MULTISPECIES: SpoIIE family protein phosphatase [Nocardia]MCM6775048.1 SpoIIE family protein phosphatase [Nocardia pulmonis]MCM6789518.1 SpoIIE family protein phosphatase [Nocardia sp. CDC159]